MLFLPNSFAVSNSSTGWSCCISLSVWRAVAPRCRAGQGPRVLVVLGCLGLSHLPGLLCPAKQRGCSAGCLLLLAVVSSWCVVPVLRDAGAAGAGEAAAPRPGCGGGHGDPLGSLRRWVHGEAQRLRSGLCQSQHQRCSDRGDGRFSPAAPAAAARCNYSFKQQ